MVKYYISTILIFCISAICISQNFRFALVTDTHISINKPVATEDLNKIVDEINQLPDIDFVVFDGDITDSGDKPSLLLAKQIISKLKIPWYITSGNHDTKTPQNAEPEFRNIFGTDKFSFKHKGYSFIGLNSGPYQLLTEGHIYPQDIKWLKKELKKKRQYFIFTHYPLLKGDVDNHSKITALLKKYNVIAVISGHYHRNVLVNYENIPGIVCRSALRGNANAGAYTIFQITDTTLNAFEKPFDSEPVNWMTLPLGR